MPLLKDIFDKYVLLPAGYWEYVRYANSNLEFNFFNIENSRSAIVNGVEYKSASKTAGKICAVVFSPADLDIVEEGHNAILNDNKIVAISSIDANETIKLKL